MFSRNENSDKALQKAVDRRLQRSGAGAQSGVSASVQHGNVTLAGKLRYETQRLSIVKAMRGVAGVRQVIDQLQSPPRPQSLQRGGA